MSTGYISLEPEWGDCLALTSDDRNRVLRLAELYGWSDPEAASALLHPGDGVDDDVGVLTAEQADGLADALAEALDDIPGHDARGYKLRPCPWAGPHAAEEGWVEEDPANPLSPLERFSGDDKDFIRELVALCRRGCLGVVLERW